MSEYGKKRTVPFVRVPESNLCNDWMNLSTLSLKRLVQLAILRSRQVEAVKMCKSERSSAACTHAQSKVQRSENNKSAVCRTGQEQLLYIEVLVQSAVVSVKHKDNF